ncbi:MAG: hypothetical protein LUB61_04155 [Eggerthellaceae bacterium]|nr:hypothetical protein [Eggerthellaceae bacterium]
MPRLPFKRPADPLYLEREAREKNAAWMNYVLPAAITDLKQAAGRLIRKADDHGFVILADHRLEYKSYSNIVLSSMPSSNIRHLTIDETIAELSS